MLSLSDCRAPLGIHPAVFLWHHAVMASVASEMMPPAKIEALRRVFDGHDRIAQAILRRFPGPAPAERITGRAYLLCITPRSGSSMLADVLGRTESVGTAHEHFSASPDDPLPEWMTPCANLDEVLRMLQANSPSGYFGIKGDLYQMFPLIAEGVFAGPDCIFKHIYLTLRDHVGQAISLARAVKTNEWHSRDAPVPDPDLMFEDVLSYLRYLRQMEADWETVFSALQIRPLRLYYEDLIADPAGVFEQTRECLEVEWTVEPSSVVSAFQSVHDRHDPQWIQSLRAQFEAPY
jgi:trehalose 2-sulfotransferase